jgi:hypothetical protein
MTTTYVYVLILFRCRSSRRAYTIAADIHMRMPHTYFSDAAAADTLHTQHQTPYILSACVAVAALVAR